MFYVADPGMVLLILILFIDSQNATSGYSVLTVRATDKDDGSNSEISFEFKAGSHVGNLYLFLFEMSSIKLSQNPKKPFEFKPEMYAFPSIASWFYLTTFQK